MTHFIFDCDDVLLDWQEGFRQHLWTQFRIYTDPTGPKSWDLSKWIGVTEQQAKDLIAHFNRSPAFGNLKACEHAKQVIWSLHDAGHATTLLTACGDAPSQKRDRIENLADQFKRLDALPYESVHILPLGASKFEFLYAASRQHTHLTLVEDNFTHAQSGVVNGIKSYCLRRSHNRAEERENPASGVIWIDNLLQISA